jgi:hypothetical protein
MKNFVAYLVLILIVGLLWLKSGFWSYQREDFLPQKVLDQSMPFSVTINKVLLDTLTPADVTSGTSSKGL